MATARRWDAFVEGVGSDKVVDLLHATDGWIAPTQSSAHQLVYIQRMCASSYQILEPLFILQCPMRGERLE